MSTQKNNGIVAKKDSANSAAKTVATKQNQNVKSETTKSDSSSSDSEKKPIQKTKTPISQLDCGKNGKPPCTVQDLIDAGWSPNEIGSAYAASSSVQNTLLCEQFGINC